ncbi:regulatory protein RecX [Thermicanus aegyptius]|uniref:regulatory protein RecX n=1 Tax=Thermicanus aegyptius TaxID=94009 RepID=UPI0003FA58F4|nr:RecX family transcriptional regulator [Thermicanus aegyptius]
MKGGRMVGREEEHYRVEKLTEKGEGRWRILLSNGEEIEVEEEVVIDHRLLPGQEISPSIREEMGRLNRIASGYGKAISYLSYRPRSTAEVKRYLIGKGYEREAAAILKRLEEKGYLDDRTFAAMWVRERLALKPRGSLLLRKELVEKGIREEWIEEALSAVKPEIEEEEALRLGRKKITALRGKEWDEIKGRLLRYLFQKGYSYSVIESILPTLKEDFRREEE